MNYNIFGIAFILQICELPLSIINYFAHLSLTRTLFTLGRKPLSIMSFKTPRSFFRTSI